VQRLSDAVGFHYPGPRIGGQLIPAVCDPIDGCRRSEITVALPRQLRVRGSGAGRDLILYTNEFEQTLSISQTIECWVNFDLRDLGFSPAASSGSSSAHPSDPARFWPLHPG
jgi:hypothetical protein